MKKSNKNKNKNNKDYNSKKQVKFVKVQKLVSKFTNTNNIFQILNN